MNAPREFNGVMHAYTCNVFSPMRRSDRCTCGAARGWTKEDQVALENSANLGAPGPRYDFNRAEDVLTYAREHDLDR
jgi:hypothetical protein